MSEQFSEQEKRYFSKKYTGRHVMGWLDVESFKSFLNCIQLYDG